MGVQECRRHAEILFGNVVMQMAVIEKGIDQVFLERFKEFHEVKPRRFSNGG